MDNGFSNFGVFFTETKFVLVIGLVILAAAFDLKSRRIPNWLVLSGLIVSLVCQTLAPTGAGFTAWGGGLVIGFAIFLPLYFLGAMGAGDVKLMAVVGSFFGGSAAFSAVLLILVAGGCVALLSALFSGHLRILVTNLRFMVTDLITNIVIGGALRATAPAQSAGGIPYGVAIAVGTLLQVLLLQSGNTLFA